VNNTSQIDPSLYGCYYVHESLDDFKLYIRHPNGDVEYTEYDIFIADNYQIIAFRNFDLGKTDYNYVLVNEEGESIVQWMPYEHFYEYAFMSSHLESDTFSFYNSVSMKQQVESKFVNAYWDYKNRCETHLFMAMAYPVGDGIKPFIADLNKINNNTIKRVASLLSVAGTSTVSYMRVSDIGTSYRDWPAVVGMSKTFMGCMKLVIEWASLAEEPFNVTDEIALDAKSYLEAIKMPPEVIDEINEYQENMPVYRYLLETDNPRQDFIEQIDISPLFLDWLRKKLRYISLNSLVANYPQDITIDSNVLAVENSKIEGVIYKTCLDFKIDSSNTTAEEIFEFIEKSENLLIPTVRPTGAEEIAAKKALLSYMTYN
jgi:hypothetical protein